MNSDWKSYLITKNDIYIIFTLQIQHIFNNNNANQFEKLFLWISTRGTSNKFYAEIVCYFSDSVICYDECNKVFYYSCMNEKIRNT